MILKHTHSGVEYEFHVSNCTKLDNLTFCELSKKCFDIVSIGIEPVTPSTVLYIDGVMLVNVSVKPIGEYVKRNFLDVYKSKFIVHHYISHWEYINV